MYIKDAVQETFPDVNENIIYRTIKEIINDFDLFYAPSGLIKSYLYYPNQAVQMFEEKDFPVPRKIAEVWEKKNKIKYRVKIE